MRWASWWPPFLGAGICVTRVAPDFTHIEVELRLHWWNKNYVGTHFGGSLYSMTDPFFMVMLIENLGPGYQVWDKAATIRFKAPGRGRMKATFALSQAEVNEIRTAVDASGKAEPHFIVQVLDQTGFVIAEVEKTLSIKKR